MSFWPAARFGSLFTSDNPDLREEPHFRKELRYLAPLQQPHWHSQHVPRVPRHHPQQRCDPRLYLYFTNHMLTLQTLTLRRATVFGLKTPRSSALASSPRQSASVTTSPSFWSATGFVPLIQKNSKMKFPLPHRVLRAPSKKFRTTFKAQRPHTVF